MGRSTEDLAGRRFSRLTVISRAPKRPSGHAYWVCRCDCGNVKEITSNALRTGMTTSCGCVHREMLVARNTGVVPEPLSIHRPPSAGKPRATRRSARYKATYHSWRAMIYRCTNPDDPAWPNYGGRGITICSRWLNSFQDFLSDMGEQPLGRSLDRENNDGNYEVGNCRWATPREQARNTRSFKLTPERVREVIQLDETGADIAEVVARTGLSVKTARTVLVVAAALRANPPA